MVGTRDTYDFLIVLQVMDSAFVIYYSNQLLEQTKIDLRILTKFYICIELGSFKLE